MDDQLFCRIDKLFAKLMEELKGRFVESEFEEVKLYVDVGEEGLALETLVGIIVCNNRVITEISMQLIDQLHTEMGMSNPSRKKMESLITRKIDEQES